MNFSDLEQLELIAIKKREEQDNECLECPSCRSRWFEQIKVSQYKADHFVVLGQAVPVKPNSLEYVFLKCIQCSELLEPRISRNAQDTASGAYDKLLDTLEAQEKNKKLETINLTNEEINSLKSFLVQKETEVPQTKKPGKKQTTNIESTNG